MIGTLDGLYLPSFNGDVFLDGPFAQPPVANFRLRHPESLNESWRPPAAPVVLGKRGSDVGLALGEGGKEFQAPQ